MVVQTNPVYDVRIIIILFFTYLLMLSDVQLFIQAIHIMTFSDCRADLVERS